MSSISFNLQSHIKNPPPINVLVDIQEKPKSLAFSRQRSFTFKPIADTLEKKTFEIPGVDDLKSIAISVCVGTLSHQASIILYDEPTGSFRQIEAINLTYSLSFADQPALPFKISQSASAALNYQFSFKLKASSNPETTLSLPAEALRMLSK